MRSVIIIGSGIAGMNCAVRCAENGIRVQLLSPFPSERSQSVMAAGGINAVTDEHEEGDSVDSHIADTLSGGCDIAGINAVTGLCSNAGNIIRYLERIGTVFTTDGSGRPVRRAFGGQSHRRTYFCGTSTGKQIVSSLVMEARRYEAKGLISRRLWCCFHSALIRDGVCYGAVVFDESKRSLEAIYGDALIIATGGQNALFGKTTGSTQCDGYAAGRLFMQGVELKNLEFIQYHPTTLVTSQKKMLISEAVRGEGGRLFYEDNGARVYFMEEKFGPRGNLMTRDVISAEMEKTGRDVYLDAAVIGRETIDAKLEEVRDICAKYRGIDIVSSPIPVTPSVHFFMGGIAVHLNHETNIRNLYAIGECASIYHGANRIGGNSLLAALYGGKVAADDILSRGESEGSSGNVPDFSNELEAARTELSVHDSSTSKFPVMYVRDMLADTMNANMGIVRDGVRMAKGIGDVDYYLSVADKLNYDRNVMPYFNYSLKGILTLARAVLTCADERRESRGSHLRSDHPERNSDFGYASVIRYGNGSYDVRYDKEFEYES